jgi:hypothetical protein
MAKKTSKPKQLSPSDQAIYDAMPVSTQNFVNGISNPAAKSAYIQDWASSPAGKAASTGTTTTTVPATAPTTTSVGLEPFNPNIAAGTPDQTRFQPALGTEVGRRVDLMGRPVAGSAGRISAPADPERDRFTGGPGYTPLYYEDSADLINSFGYEKIAEIQNKLVKAGLLGNKYALGRVDNATRNAWIDLLEQANRIPEPGGKTSVDWNTALNIATTSPPGGTGKLPPKVSNPADILKVARQVSRNVLGREDDTILNDIVQAFQRSQVREQTGQLRMRDGMRVDTPGLEAFAERKIQQAAGPEADAYKFAQFADNLFGMAGSGEGVQRDVELEAVDG